MSNSPKGIPTNEEAGSVASSILGRSPCRTECLWPKIKTNDCYTYRIWVSETPMLLKISKRPDVPMGLYFYQRLREAGIPVPELIAFSPDAGPAGQACAVWEWVEGISSRNWTEGEPCPFDEAEFGELMRRIHELEFDGQFGLLGDDPSRRGYTWGPSIRPASDSWSGVFDFRTAGRGLLDLGYLNREEFNVFSRLPETLSDELNARPCRLLHCDLRSNLILDPQTREVRVVVDYTESFAGDPRLELAIVDYWFSDRIVHFLPFDMERFRTGYGTKHNPRDPLGRFYLAVILASDGLPSWDGRSLKGQWSITTLKAILHTFEVEA